MQLALALDKTLRPFEAQEVLAGAILRLPHLEKATALG
jgi:hypothetical protein